MDPYESQYQQYCNHERNNNDGHQEQEAQTVNSFATAAVTMDPYEQQYQQYYHHGQQNDQIPIIDEDQTSSYSNSVTMNHYEQQQYQQQSMDEMKQTSFYNSNSVATTTDTYDQQQQYQQQTMNEEQTSSFNGNSVVTTMDPYEQQYQQQSMDDGQTSFNSNTVNTDSYEQQYQQSISHYPDVTPIEDHRTTNTHNPNNNNEMTDLLSNLTPQLVNTDQQQNMNAEKDFDNTNNNNNINNIIQQQEQVIQQLENEPPSLQNEQLSEEDRYLRMVSNEIQYKKLLGENPYAITDIPLKVMMGRALDNLEDAFQKNNGKVKGQSKLKGKDMPKEERKTVVVLGTGWAAHAFIKLASTYDLRIVVVSPVNHFVFTPMLASAAVGTIEYRSMTEPIRVTNPFIDNYVEGSAIGIDVPNKLLTVQLTSLATVTGAFKGIAANAPCRLEPEPIITEATNGNQEDNTGGAARVIELNYDYLVCAVGTASRSSIVPGAKDYCFNLKTSQDSKRLRTAIGEALEYASRPDVQEKYYLDPDQQELAYLERRRRLRFVLVGGGPTGVELAGELCDFFAQVCRKPDGAFQHLAKDISVVLVHGGSELLPAMDKDLRQKAMVAMQSQGVELCLNTRLQEVGQDFVRIKEKGSDEEVTVPVGLTVWAAGNAPVPFVQELLSQLPESAAGSAGRINVDRWLRCPTPTAETFGSILVLGDVACMELESKYDPTPKALPQTAQVAGQQGAFAARLLNRGYDLQLTPPKLPSEYDEFSLLRIWLLSRSMVAAPEFTFLSLGLLAYVGREEALNQVALGDVPIFNYSGKVAFALWRSVYLAKQASTRNQALISFDWLRTEAFGRDITRL